MNDETEELKIWIVVRKDLDMPAGKLAVQVAHAATSIIYFNYFKEKVRRYMTASQPKICVKVKNTEALLRAERECKENKIGTYLIRDEGRTVFNEPTITCLAVGPCFRSDLPNFVQKLQLY